MKGNHIKKIRVKVKEKPLQFFVTLGCFAFLALLIFLGMLTQSSRDRKFSREQKTVLLEERQLIHCARQVSVVSMS